MADIASPTVPACSVHLNVTDRLSAMAAALPDVTAVACPRRFLPDYRETRRGDRRTPYSVISFAELDVNVTQIARGLAAWGIPPGTRLALLVRPGIEFVTLVFALLRAGVVIILIDPGLGRRNLVRCLSEANPEGFVAASVTQAARIVLRHRFPHAKWNVTVGRRWFWGGVTLDQLRRADRGAQNPASRGVLDPGHPQSRVPSGCRIPQSPDHPAAIIFTSGSTGPPKGVLYTHRMFDTQVSEIQSMYGIEPGGVDLACFPLFALFNAAMGVTTVLPEMDFSHPAAADPKKLLAAANDWQVTQAFASPAVWRGLSHHCAKTGERIPTLRQVFSCGAPVAASVQRATLTCVARDAQMHTPYGATECLPVSTIESAEVLAETASKTDQGAGVCVGRKFDSIDWRVIRITDGPIATMNDTEILPTGEIGELIVRGPQVSPQYMTRTEANATSKIADRQSAIRNPQSEISNLKSQMTNLRFQISDWHRTGDVGYLDADGRFWYCGRKSQRVETPHGPLFAECVEAVFNAHPIVRRSALVGIGPRPKQTPVLVAELGSGHDPISWRETLLEVAQKHKHTRVIKHFLRHAQLPVDIRHNAKINREKLAVWAAKKFKHGLVTRRTGHFSDQLNYTDQHLSTQSVEVLRPHAERGNENA